MEPNAALAELQKWKADQWDRLVANITYDERNRRFVIYDHILAQHGIDIRDDHIEIHCSPDGWPKAVLKGHQFGQLENVYNDLN